MIDASGKPGTVSTAVNLTRSAGLVILKSTCAPTSESPSCLDLSNCNDIVVREITVRGSRCGPFERALTALSEGSVRVEGLIEARFSLEEASEAIKRAMKPGTLKVLIEM